MYWGEERRLQVFGGGNLRVRDQLGDTGVDGRIILRWISKKWNVWYVVDRPRSG